MVAKLTLVSHTKTLKRAASKSTAYVSGGYEYDRRHFEFARSHDKSTGELESIRLPTPYLTIILQCVSAMLVLGAVVWAWW